MDDVKVRMLAHSRFPYTYAADFVRGAGLAESRADASQWRKKMAEKLGWDDAEFARNLALKYVDYWAAVEELDRSREESFAALRALPTP